MNTHDPTVVPGGEVLMEDDIRSESSFTAVRLLADLDGLISTLTATNIVGGIAGGRASRGIR